MVKVEWKPRWFGWRFEVVCPKTKKPVNVLSCYGCESFTSAEITASKRVVNGNLVCKSEEI